MYICMWVYIPPLRPHLEQVEHRHYSWGLSNVHALPSGCGLSGVIALDHSPGESNAIGAFPVSFVEFPGEGHKGSQNISRLFKVGT